MLDLTIRVVASLAVVVGLMLLLAKVAGRRFAARPGAPVQVLHRQPLSRSASVTVLTVGHRVLVVGTTEHQVSLLAELDPEEIEVPEIELDEVRDAAVTEQELLEVPATLPAPTPIRPAVDHRPAAGPQRAEGQGALSGSVLSVETWRQALAAVTGRMS